MFSDEAAVALLAARSSAGIAPIVVVGSHEDMNVVSSLPEALVNTPWVGKRDTFVPLREATLEEGTLSVPYSRAQLQGAPMIDPDGALEDWEEAKLQPLRDPYPQQAGLRMTRYYDLFPNRRLWRPPLQDRFPTQQGRQP
jgi:hypothetical protein